MEHRRGEDWAAFKEGEEGGRGEGAGREGSRVGGGHSILLKQPPTPRQTLSYVVPAEFFICLLVYYL